MGVYDSGLNLDFIKFDKKKFLPIIGAIVLIIILAYAAIYAVSNYEPSPIEFRFEKNPIKSGEETKIFIIISNQTKTDAEDVSLILKAKEISDFDVIPLNEKFDGSIKFLSSGTSREITFLINPIGEVLPGTYTLVAESAINGQLHTKETKLFVEN
ncbi:MAG: hypothetical protein CL944_00060 [Candidatus Diapherotrites archaeon]|uniref:Uncharacterized protein n=1 Tax=Candidatus Iainarchaeum sp. TaxID=3101447 RepID=A0A2D6LP48_9ARCH|nr:hypothetical protein [Candidatus Diapherotrites archaeon]|tara:strand:- start:20876 stop:21343 length:468 start_codon:yes stop_codon:yes gene_type:complete